MCRPPPEYKDVGEVWTDTWEEYFRDVMMMGLIKKLTKSARERDIDSVDMARKVTEQVVPKLLGELGEVEPVLLHSDLCRYCLECKSNIFWIFLMTCFSP